MPPLLSWRTSRRKISTFPQGKEDPSAAAGGSFLCRAILVLMSVVIPFEGGVPDVTGLDKEEIFRQGRLYMERFFIGSSWERFHHIVDSDPEVLHNHPWDFISLLLSGGYRETTLDGEVEHYAPCLIAREAVEFHRLTLLDGPVWSFVTTGPVINTWGFLTEDGFVNHRNYLR